MTVLHQAGIVSSAQKAPKGWTGSLAANLKQELLPGPRLDGVRDRLQADWVRRWLHEPHALRPGTMMPAPSANIDEASLKTIALYLTSAPAKSKLNGSAEKGLTICKQAGCAACHEAPKGNAAELPVPSFTGLAAKWTGPGLAQFLRRPLDSRPHGRMPDFALSDSEADDLAAYLLNRPDAGAPGANTEPLPVTAEELSAQWTARGEDAAKLKNLRRDEQIEVVAWRHMIATGCYNCHDLGGNKALPLTRRDTGAPTSTVAVQAPQGPTLLDLTGEQLMRGCLGTDEATRKGAPRFQFAPEERAALTAYVASLSNRSAASTAERMRMDFKLLNCAACHQNEGTGGKALLTLLGGGNEAKWLVPHDLTGVATRLRPERLLEYLEEGARQHRLRPWLGARMPGFGGRGQRLADGLCVRDGVDGPVRPTVSSKPPKPAPPTTVAPEHVELGRFLVGSKAMSCTSCHQLNTQGVQVIDPTTRGPDLALVTDHLRFDYFQRLLSDPARVFPDTKMPQILREGRFPLPALQDMPGPMQVQAFWNYLSLGKNAPPPREESPTEVILAITRPSVQRGLTKCQGKFHPRGINVGFPEGTILYDADLLSPVALWWGGFVKSESERYFGLRWQPASTDVEGLPSQPHLLSFRLADAPAWQTSPLPMQSDPNTGTRFDGYVVGKNMITFQYRLLVGERQVAIVDKLGLDNRPGWRGLARELTVSGLPKGTRVAMTFGPTTDFTLVAADGSAATPETQAKAPVLLFTGRDSGRAVRVDGGADAAWEEGGKSGGPLRLVSAPVADDQPVRLRLDWWSFPGKSKPAAAELASLCEGQKLRSFEKSQPPPNRPAPPAEAPPASDEKPFTYKVEKIAAPPGDWRPNGVAFDSRGQMYALGMTDGKLWRSPAPGAGPSPEVKWKLYASGLNHPIGVAMVEDRLYVSQKPELTELLDPGNTGMATHFRTVMGCWGLSDGYHEYAFGIGVDRDQALYVALTTGFFWTHPGHVNPGRFRGSIMRVDRQGRIEEFAKGCRVPNGICRGPDGDVFFCDNQGDWIQECKLAHIQKGRFYGHPETKAAALPPGRYPNGEAACWLPYDHCKSGAGPVLDETGGKFGPFAGQFIIGDVGYGDSKTMVRAALEKVEGEYQGVCFLFSKEQARGPNHMTFGPDNHLYVSTLAGGLVRIRYGGKMPMEMHHVNIRPEGEGFVVHFTKPLAEGTDAAKLFRARRWHLLYSGQYGSPRLGSKDVAISKAELSADRRSVTLTLPVETHPIGMVYYLATNKATADDGDALVNPEAWYTVNRIPKK
jgi:mono/diheme cytochrome c family protein